MGKKSKAKKEFSVIMLDWKQFSDEALKEFKKVLASHGLKLVSHFKGESADYVLSVAKKGTNVTDSDITELEQAGQAPYVRIDI